jgi:hypothetical protein
MKVVLKTNMVNIPPRRKQIRRPFILQAKEF